MFLFYWRAGTNWPKDKAGNGYGQSLLRKIEKVKRLILVYNWLIPFMTKRILLLLIQNEKILKIKEILCENAFLKAVKCSLQFHYIEIHYVLPFCTSKD